MLSNKFQSSLPLAEVPIEELLRNKATTNSFLYKDKVAIIRKTVCPMYVGIPYNISLTDQFQICKTCMDSACYTRY